MHRYEDLFHDMKTSCNTIVEIGVRKGNSLRVWKEYFLNSRIIGLDIDPSCASAAEDRIDIYTGSQIDDGTLQTIINDTPNGLDIVIDDGSHLAEHLVYTFDKLFPHVNSGGWYVMEDLANSHRDLTKDVKEWQGMHLNKPNTDYTNKRYLMDAFVLQKIRDLDHLRGNIDLFVVMSQMIAFKRK